MANRKNESDWKTEARNMRRRGLPFREIAESLGKSPRDAEAACRGIKVGEAQPGQYRRLMDEFGIRVTQKQENRCSERGGPSYPVMISLPLLSIMVEGDRG